MKNKIISDLLAARSAHDRGSRIVLTVFSWLVLLAIAAWGIRPLRAEVTLEIFKAEAEKILVGLLPLQIQDISQQDSKLVRDVLLKDLQRSQVFRPMEVTDPKWKFSNHPLTEEVKPLGTEGIQAAIWGKLIRTSGDYRFDGHVYDVPTGATISERRYVGQLQPPEKQFRLIVHRFVDEVVYQFTGERGIAQTRIAYSSDQSGFKEIYIIDYDGYDPRRITGDRSIALTPRWSPDGRYLAYVTYKDGNPSIYLHELVTARRTKLVAFPGLNISPAWSPGGDRIAFATTKDGNAEIYMADLPELRAEGGQSLKAEGVQAHRLTFSLGDDLSPTWSPTGQQIAFNSDRGGTPQIYIMDAGGSNVRRLTFEGNYNTSPAWSPKGDWIAYTCRRESYLKLCLISPDGQSMLQVTDGPWSDEAPSWSPNGRYLVFSSLRGGKSHLYLITPGGKDEEQLTFTTANEIVPGWSWN
ncbi:MAG: Tol-Pal system beta propeller repeat protein TolB [Nitrospiria bacterium]